MKYGFVLPGGDAREKLEQALLAERAGWDGIFVCELAHWLSNRGAPSSFDIVVEGESPLEHRAAAAAKVRPWQAAGATWWIESRWPICPEAAGLVRRVRQRLEAGPPA